MLHLAGLALALGVGELLRDVVIVSAFRMPAGVGLRVKGPEWSIDPANFMDASHSFEIVGAEPQRTHPLTEF